MATFYQLFENHVVLFLHLQPGAKQSGFAGLHGERLKIRIKAPPIDGKANDELIRFLAEEFGMAKSQIMISSGELGRQKTVTLSGTNKLPSALEIYIGNL